MHFSTAVTGGQEEGVDVEEVKTDEALQDVWKIEPQHIVFERDEAGVFKKLGQGQPPPLSSEAGATCRSKTCKGQSTACAGAP